MKIETWAIDRLVPYARNPRRNEQAVDVVAASIKEFGWKQPIVVDADCVVVVGHTRLLAAKKLGFTDVPVLVASDLTPAQIKAYRLADNRVGEYAEWDNELLGLEFEELKIEGFDLALTGFPESEVAKLLAPLETNEADSEAPGSFKEYGEDIETEHECPKCGYRFSGGAQ